MIAVDTFAIVAIALNEAERERFMQLIVASKRALISAATLVDARIVIRSRSLLFNGNDFSQTDVRVCDVLE